MLDPCLINYLLGDHVISREGNKKFSFVLTFNNTIFFSPRDIFLAFKFFHFDLGFKLRWVRGYRLKNKIFLIKSLNGFVVINLEKGWVKKFLLVEHEPNFVKNEIIASELYSENTAEITSVYRIGDYAGVAQKFVAGNRSLSWADWSLGLPALLAMLHLYSGFFGEISASEKCVEIENSLDQVAAKDKFFQKFHNRVHSRLKFILRHYLQNSPTTYRVFCHGDLTPNNVLNFQGKNYFIDFTNGGIHNFTYDLLVQNIYHPNSPTWLEFDHLDFITNCDPSVFFGASAFFFELVSSSKGISLENRDVQFSLVVALAEIYIKNNKRHQSDDWGEGEEFIRNIEIILHHIVKSIECKDRVSI